MEVCFIQVKNPAVFPSGSAKKAVDLTPYVGLLQVLEAFDHAARLSGAENKITRYQNVRACV
jgi:hypothetical protein